MNELWRRNNLKLTVDTAGARGALSKYVMNPSISGAAKQQSPDHRMADENSPVEEDKTNMIPIANFKSNKLSQIDRKQRQEEFEKLKANPTPASPKMQDAIRLPNKVTSKPEASAGGGGSKPLEQEIASPTSYLSGGRIESFFNADDKNSV